tara:strand:+ start:4346 stop:4612 length:267 start_codon:yes stop_codon:yes gene_type:complete
MAFKGVLPSDLWEKYDCEGGQQKLLLDLNVAAEMQEKIAEATNNAKNKASSGKDMVARRNQRRAQRQVLSDTDGIDMLKSIGVAFEKQ